jgi:hypothetical protein
MAMQLEKTIEALTKRQSKPLVACERFSLPKSCIVVASLSMLCGQGVLCPQAIGRDERSMPMVKNNQRPTIMQQRDRRHDVSGLHQTEARVIFRKVTQSAPGSDSPQDTPDIGDSNRVNDNTDIAETVAASLIRQHEFSQLEDIDTSYVTVGPQSQKNVFHLTSGNALFVPKKDILVLTDEGQIHINGGSVVLIMRPAPGIISVYDLHDSGGKSIIVNTKGETLKLSPGHQVILTDQPSEFAKINPCHSIGYRKAEQKNLRSGFRAHSAEFSIASALVSVKPLKNMLLSNNKDDRKLAYQLLKDAVILFDVYKDDQPYQTSKSEPIKVTTKAN